MYHPHAFPGLYRGRPEHDFVLVFVGPVRGARQRIVGVEHEPVVSRPFLYPFVRRGEPLQEVLPVVVPQDDGVHHRSGLVGEVVGDAVQALQLAEAVALVHRHDQEGVAAVSLVHVHLALVDEVHAAVHVAFFHQVVAWNEILI